MECVPASGWFYNSPMLELSRTVRFCLSDGPWDAQGPSGCNRPKSNTYSAWPAMQGLGRYYELVVRCRGDADRGTGYLLNIKEIDQAVRQHLLPLLQAKVALPGAASQVAMGGLMRELFGKLQEPLGQMVHSLRLQLSSMVSLEMERCDMNCVIIRQRYEFSAAHRLHVPELSAEENARIFGKCNNPAGHGHNYRVEVAMRVPIDEKGQVMTVQQLDALVERFVVEKLDHKHLNIDVPQFADLNPSVENISRVIWSMLLEGLKVCGIAPQVRLEEISVWETEKTVCTYRGVEAVAGSA
jgi:6-pyruvoyltetrahydropterin/6-carboxytetrahydropterin synthase